MSNASGGMCKNPVTTNGAGAGVDDPHTKVKIDRGPTHNWRYITSFDLHNRKV